MIRGLPAILSAAVLLLAGCGQNQNTETMADLDAGMETAPRSAAPARSTSPSTISVPSGTVMNVRLNQTLNSGSSAAGEDFTAEVTQDVRVGGGVAIPAGSTVHGTVRDVVPAKRGAGNAKMTLAFTRLELPDGGSGNMVASLSEGTASKKKRNAAIIGGSAAGGALLGRILGKDTKGAVVGAIVGGGIGTGVVMSKEGAQVNLPAGTELAVQLDEPMKLPR